MAGPLRRRRRKSLLWLALGVLALSGVATGYWLVIREPGADAADATSGAVATTRVQRQTIAATETWSGELGHGAAYPVRAEIGGTVTRLARQHERVRRGSELYRVDERPVVAMIGSIPMYRALSVGDEGVDVKQFEANLAKLGYRGFDVDEEFTSYTALAVEEWQDDVGVVETGSVARPDVVFVPQPGRVDSVKVSVGDTVAPGSEVLDVTSGDQIVSLEVDVADRDLVRVDTVVTIRLPGDVTVKGTVTSVSMVEDASGGGADGAEGEEDPGADDVVAAVEVTLNKKVAGSLLGSPVDVRVRVEQRKDVLVVPISALLALADGGFGLEVVADDGSTSLVPVQTGLFTDGLVEVEGEGISRGTVVGVAGR